MTRVIFTLLLTLATLCGGDAVQISRRATGIRWTATTTESR